MQISEEASEAHCIVLDGLPAPTLATFLHLCIDIANPELRQAHLVATRPQFGQEFQGLCCTFRPCC